MKKLHAEEVLIMMIDILLEYLDELKEYKDESKTQFQYGERTAYTECLEFLQLWEKSTEHGLGFDIEKVYPL